MDSNTQQTGSNAAVNPNFAGLRVITVARGPKPVAALRELGLEPTITIPEPNTWQEILSALSARTTLDGKRVAVQEYGVSNPDLLAGLETRGAVVFAVPVYRWT